MVIMIWDKRGGLEHFVRTLSKWQCSYSNMGQYPVKYGMYEILNPAMSLVGFLSYYFSIKI